ncbi:MAG: Putative membrane protein [uncultured Sulfurovum sp.]|uniref:Membrane protein n=1 Tax=uncultured Sulfurovum sp. TaxID=269237 RepID=A0A6S6SJV6_9BACT|nr:MAG: Putative membrane protein [uncultured Sulfurovum sp.]
MWLRILITLILCPIRLDWANKMFRQFISLTLLVSLVALSSSGIMMILLGSFEFQLQMHPVHKIFGILLTLSGAFHVYYNFGAIKKYLSKKKSMLFALIMTFIMIALYAIGMAKPIDLDKVHQIEEIMKTMEG